MSRTKERLHVAQRRNQTSAAEGLKQSQKRGAGRFSLFTQGEQQSVWLHGKRFEAQTRLCSSKLERLKVTHDENQLKADK